MVQNKGEEKRWFTTNRDKNEKRVNNKRERERELLLHVGHQSLLQYIAQSTGVWFKTNRERGKG